VNRQLPDGYELDDDPSRLDLDAIWAFLSTEAYWGTDRSRETVEGQVRAAARTVGLYHEGRQVGFARIVSDGRIAYLADVYVLQDHRGHGLGVELVRACVDEGPQRDLRWLLHTKDAHGLYERFGFGAPSEPGARAPAGRRARVRRGQAGATAPAYRSAHSPIASIAVPSPAPASVSEYSISTGRPPCTVRTTMPSASSCLRRSESRLSEIPGTRSRSSPNRAGPYRSTRITCGFHRRPSISAAR